MNDDAKRRLAGNIFICVCAVLLNVVMFNRAQAQDNIDSTKKELDKLLTSKDPADQQVLYKRLKVLAASDTELNMSIAADYYYKLKNTRVFDSITTAEVQKFPKGLQARINAQQAITRINNLADMESAYKEFINSFPPESYTPLPLGQDRLPYDRVRIRLAVGYAKEKNAAKAHYYAGLLEADFWKCKAYRELSDAFYANSDLANATLYQQKAVESIVPYAEGKMGNSPAARFAATRYAEECRNYARLLYEQGSYNKALQYIETAIKAAGTPKPEFDYVYAEILAALNRNKEAYARMEAVMRSGKANEEMWQQFKTLYVKAKGSDAGLDTYLAALRKGVNNDLQTRLAGMMVNKPAADFTLTDLQGNRVHLADLKGKIVILDFWATWCVPCKASFPAMQMAVDKYKNDPNVRFLFIHTWERTATPLADVKAYITGMKYRFQVLMDTKDPETKANKVVNSYNVASIPTKFVIDGAGNIRFRVKGFDGSKEAAVDEISMMIDIVRGSGE